MLSSKWNKGALSGCLLVMLGYAEPAFSQPSDAGLSACGQFTATRPFGDTEFEFQHINFERCSQLLPAGQTLVDADVMRLEDGGETYMVTCRCTQDALTNGSSGK